jgi:toxin-antitoxin system PIN domain toxin
LPRPYLLDLNVLVALTDDEHKHFGKAQTWFHSVRHEEWGNCPLTEAGYIRLVANPATGFPQGSLKRAIDVLSVVTDNPNHRFWPMTESWTTLTAPFADRIFGHQQVTDAYLLGLAIKENGILVTFDRGLKYLAGPQFSRNLLVLE